jgi:hypothetical protein
MIAGAFVMAVCCSASSAAMLVMGGDEEKTTTGPGPSSPGPAPRRSYRTARPAPTTQVHA